MTYKFRHNVSTEGTIVYWDDKSQLRQAAEILCVSGSYHILYEMAVGHI